MDHGSERSTRPLNGSCPRDLIVAAAAGLTPVHRNRLDGGEDVLQEHKDLRGIRRAPPPGFDQEEGQGLPSCQGVTAGFQQHDPLPSLEGPVAQWLEPAAHNGLVAGSSPAGPTILSAASDAEFASSAISGSSLMTATAQYLSCRVASFLTSAMAILTSGREATAAASNSCLQSLQSNCALNCSFLMRTLNLFLQAGQPMSIRLLPKSSRIFRSAFR